MDNDLFGGFVVSSYSRAQALEDGVLVDITHIAKQAGFKFPTVVSQALWALIEPSPELMFHGESKDSRIWDVCFMAGHAMRAVRKSSQADFKVFLRQNKRNSEDKDTYDCYIVCGPGDTAEPVLTIMLKGED